MRKILALLILFFTGCGGLFYVAKNSGIYEVNFAPTTINCTGDETQKIKSFTQDIAFYDGIFDFNFMPKAFDKCPKEKLSINILGNFSSSQNCKINKKINKIPITITLFKQTKGKFDADLINGTQNLLAKFFRNGVEIYSCETTLNFAGKLKN